MEQEIIIEDKDINSLTYNYSKDGVQLRKELDKKILSNTGLWADVAFLYQDCSNYGDWKDARITIVRFKKTYGVWKKQNHLNINNIIRIDNIIEILSNWRNNLK